MATKNASPCKASNSQIQYQALFVYGSLRRDVNDGLCELLERYTDFIDYGTYQGLLYNIDNYPGAVASNNPSHLVVGEVYRLHDPNRVLSRLDVYEECSPSFSKPTEYLRDIQYVQLLNNDIIPAWIYLYNYPTDNLQLIASGDFLSLQDSLL
jgi:gamma-glutamylcyclotransferase (GGCT)/AIG2-like uncharacterized protein YtfP